MPCMGEHSRSIVGRETVESEVLVQVGHGALALAIARRVRRRWRMHRRDSRDEEHWHRLHRLDRQQQVPHLLTEPFENPASHLQLRHVRDDRQARAARCHRRHVQDDLHFRSWMGTLRGRETFRNGFKNSASQQLGFRYFDFADHSEGDKGSSAMMGVLLIQLTTFTNIF